MNDSAFALLKHPTPVISIGEAQQLLMERYGVRGELQPLVSERDLNFQLVGDGPEGLLKFSNAAEPVEMTEFQTGVMQQLQQRPLSVSTQFAMPDRQGRLLSRYVAICGEQYTVRLLQWISGKPLKGAAPDTELVQSLGRLLAEVGIGLKDYEHTADRPALLWDMQQCHQLLPLVTSIQNAGLRLFCERWLEDMSDRVLPQVASLHTQVIYNDLNHSNVLISPDDASQPVGLIDFGDVVRAPLVIDVAVACAYLCQMGPDPYLRVREFLDGYQTLRPLLSTELIWLHELIQTRMVMTIVITNWRAKRHPENRGYILRNEPEARRQLQHLNQLAGDAVLTEHLQRTGTGS